MTNTLKKIIYSPRKSDYASHIQRLPEITLKTKTTSAMTQSFTDYIKRPSMPSMSMPHISMPTFSASSISLPKLSLHSFPKLTLPSLKENLTTSSLLPFLLILLFLSLIAYILHTYLITPRKSSRHVTFVEDTGPPPLRTLDLMERCRAQARRDYALGRLSAQPSQAQQWRADVAAFGGVGPPPPYPPVEARRVVYAPSREPWVPARAPRPSALPVLRESPVPMTPVQESHQSEVRMPSPAPSGGLVARPAPSGGLVARMVEVVSLRRSTRVKRAPERFDEMEFPKGRRT